jgi:hypothetical protein
VNGEAKKSVLLYPSAYSKSRHSALPKCEDSCWNIVRVRLSKFLIKLTFNCMETLLFTGGFPAKKEEPFVSVLVGARHTFTIGACPTCSTYWCRAPHATVMYIYVHWHVRVVCRNGRLI